MIILLFSLLAHAQIYNSSISAATAGAGVASIDIGEASFNNPATLVHLQGRNILYSQGQSEYAVFTSDNSRDIVFPAAVAYVQINDEDADIIVKDLRLTLADTIGGQWGFGVTIHQYQVVATQNFKENNADVGLIYIPNPDWGVGFTTYNVSGGQEEVPEAFRLHKKTALGLNYLFGKIMRFRLDVRSAPNNNFSLPTTMAGYEIYLNEFILARLGYQEDRHSEVNEASLGIGFDLPKFDLKYAYVRHVPENLREKHSIDLAITFL
jgi:hypothetical protein